jgi:hypothetical protein
MIAKIFEEKVNNLLKKTSWERTCKKMTSCKWNHYF